MALCSCSLLLLKAGTPTSELPMDCLLSRACDTLQHLVTYVCLITLAQSETYARPGLPR